MNAKDTARLEQLKLRVWAKVASRLIKGKNNPYHVSDRDIENKGNRINKAKTMLRDAGYIIPSSVKDNCNHTLYEVLHFEDSKNLGTAPVFDTTGKDLYKTITGVYKENHEIAGYRNISSIPPLERIYVSWHLDQYTVADDHVFPKNLQETRLKDVLRTVVEMHFQEDFWEKLETFLGLQKDSLKIVDGLLFVRNFSSTAFGFGKETIEGTGGFLEEYQHYEQYFKAVQYHIHKFLDIVRAKGGYEKIVEEMRRATMQELLHNAPLHLNDDNDDDEKEHSSFILKHANYFHYDVLYADDTSIESFKKDEKDVFEPKDEQKAVIAAMEGDYKACTAKLISETLQSICVK